MRSALSRIRPRTEFGVGVTFLIVTALAVTILAYKAPLETWWRSGETITAEFPSSYRLHANESVVKYDGLDVGVVSGVNYTNSGTALVAMKVDQSAVDVLGSRPSATIAPLTILGGVYSVELRKGGGSGPFTGSFIPRAQTSTPSELDRVLEALPTNTRANLQDLVGRLNANLSAGTRSALRRITQDAPKVLAPAGTVFTALQGTRPSGDLTTVVSGLDNIGTALTQQSGQLAGTLQSLDQSTAALAAERGALSQSLSSLPSTLSTTRVGLSDLRTSLALLTTTSRVFEPAAKQLAPFLRTANPVLAQAIPLLKNLQPLMADARPTLAQLTPAVAKGTDILQQLRGPVLARVNGPITHTIMNTWRGVGPYAGNGGGPQADHKFYQELAYMVTNLDRSSMTQDAQGSMLGFQVAVGANSLGGVPFTMPNLIAQMLKVVGVKP